MCSRQRNTFHPDPSRCDGVYHAQQPVFHPGEGITVYETLAGQEGGVDTDDEGDNRGEIDNPQSMNDPTVDLPVTDVEASKTQSITNDDRDGVYLDIIGRSPQDASLRPSTINRGTDQTGGDVSPPIPFSPHPRVT